MLFLHLLLFLLLPVLLHLLPPRTPWHKEVYLGMPVWGWILVGVLLALLFWGCCCCFFPFCCCT